MGRAHWQFLALPYMSMRTNCLAPLIVWGLCQCAVGPCDGVLCPDSSKAGVKPSRFAKKANMTPNILELLSSTERAAISAAEAKATALAARAASKVH